MPEEGRGLDTIGPKMSRSSLIGTLPPVALTPPPVPDPAELSGASEMGETDTETERERDREREGERERGRDKDGARERERDTDRETEGETDRERGRQENGKLKSY